MTGSVVPPSGSKRLDELFPAIHPPKPVDDFEKLTQFGVDSNSGPQFRNGPPKPGAREMSLIRGSKTPEEAGRLVGHFGRPETFRARYTQARVLRSKGFTVKSTPTVANPDHVSVYIDDKEWTSDTAARFSDCFGM